MALRVDYAAVAFAADYGAYFLHLCRNVHLAYCRCCVRAAVTLSYVAQGACRRKVRHGVARCVLQHVVGYAHECVFLAEHLAILADERQTVYVGVDNDAEVVLAAVHLVHYTLQVLLERFGVVGEVAVGCRVEDGIFYAERLQQVGQDDAAHAVDSVYANLELSVADSVHVSQLEAEYALDMALVERVVACVRAERIDVGIVEVFLLGDAQHLVAVVLGEELAFAVEQLQCVPLARVVTCCYDDAAEGACPAHSQLCCRRCGEVDVNNVESHTHECAANHVAYHVA